VPFFVKVGEHEVSFEDVPMDVWAKLSKEAGLPWTEVYWAPAKSAVAGPALIRWAAGYFNSPVPEPLTPRVVLDAFRWEAEDDRPSSYEDGLPS
jgi:hypothetical protein